MTGENAETTEATLSLPSVNFMSSELKKDAAKELN